VFYFQTPAANGTVSVMAGRSLLGSKKGGAGRAGTSTRKPPMPTKKPK